MKRFSLFLAVLILLLSGCSPAQEVSNIAATTLPVYEFTARLCEGTDLRITRLVTDSVSCLHDYSLNVRQVRAVESADLIVINGAGLEEFMEDLLAGKQVVDSSSGIELTQSEQCHDHDHASDEHHHEVDNHIWLSPANAAVMVENICTGLSGFYPQYQTVFEENREKLLSELAALRDYGIQELGTLSCRELVTFHDGFSYFAADFDLHILKAIEEESGSESSAAELKELISLVRQHNIPAIFTEANGSDASASVISRETGVPTFVLDMAMSGDSWFDAMYHNINTVKEALE